MVQKYTELEVIKLMKKKGHELSSPLFWSDTSQYYRECYQCNSYVDVDSQSDNCCDECATCN